MFQKFGGPWPPGYAYGCYVLLKQEINVKTLGCDPLGRYQFHSEPLRSDCNTFNFNNV